jgi:hypothetical protein
MFNTGFGAGVASRYGSGFRTLVLMADRFFCITSQSCFNLLTLLLPERKIKLALHLMAPNGA